MAAQALVAAEVEVKTALAAAAAAAAAGKGRWPGVFGGSHTQWT